MDRMTEPARSRFALYAWGALAYTVLVAVWGAAVRATGSGAGCGSHWPLCNGEVLPRSPQLETLIELSHRATSGLVGLVILGLVWGAFRSVPREWGARRWAVLSLVFTVIEGAVGAGLVKFELVATNESIERALVMAVHLVNTFLLLSAVTLTAARASGWARMRWRRGAGWVAGAMLAVLVLGTSGAVTALGDTLYPVAALDDGTLVLEELSPTGQLLVQLRVFHPWIAVAVALFLMGAAWRLRALTPTARVERLTVWLAALFAVELAAGLVNIALHAPVWMQLVHLGLAYGVWIVLTLLASAALER
jgi:heme A synthase